MMTTPQSLKSRLQGGGSGQNESNGVGETLSRPTWSNSGKADKGKKNSGPIHHPLECGGPSGGISGEPLRTAVGGISVGPP